MKLWKISQDINTSYDTYDAMIIAAETEEEARNITPNNSFDLEWCDKPEDVMVEYLGEAKDGTESGIILASYNAG